MSNLAVAAPAVSWSPRIAGSLAVPVSMAVNGLVSVEIGPWRREAASGRPGFEITAPIGLDGAEIKTAEQGRLSAPRPFFPPRLDSGLVGDAG